VAPPQENLVRTRRGFRDVPGDRVFGILLSVSLLVREVLRRMFCGCPRAGLCE